MVRRQLGPAALAISGAAAAVVAATMVLTPPAGAVAPTPATPPPAPAPAAPVMRAPPIARWATGTDAERPASPACVTRNDRFIQYADLDDAGSPRFCLWSHLDQMPADVGCWRVDLETGVYHPEGGVWFSAPVPSRVGIGGPYLGDVDQLTWRPPVHDADVELVGVVGASAMVTDCRGAGCKWDLYDPATSKRIAAVGGDHPLGSGGTAVALDGTKFAAAAGARLVIQDAASGKVTARLALPRAAHVDADAVVLGDAHQLIALTPDGRVELVDAATGKIAREIAPPACPARGQHAR